MHFFSADKLMVYMQALDEVLHPKKHIVEKRLHLW